MKKFLLSTMLLVVILLSAGLYGCQKYSFTFTVDEVRKAYTDAGFTVRDDSDRFFVDALEIWIVEKDDIQAHVFIFETIKESKDFNGRRESCKKVCQNVQINMMKSSKSNNTYIQKINDDNAKALIKPIQDLFDSKK